MKRKRSRKYSWYVYTEDAETNKNIAAELTKMHNVDGSIVWEFIPGKKEAVQIYKLERPFISMLKKNKATFNLIFTEYVKEGNGKLQEWRFANKTGKKKKKKISQKHQSNIEPKNSV